MTKKNYDLYQPLVEKKLLNEEALVHAAEIACEENRRLSEILKEKELISSDAIDEFIVDKLGIPTYELNKSQIDPGLANLIPENIARKYTVVPLFVVDNIVTIAISNALDVQAIEEIETYTGYTLNVIQSSKTMISSLIEHCYAGAVAEASDLDEMFKMGMELVASKGENEDIEELVEEAPIAKLVDMILKQAIAENASDIHIEPQEFDLRVRYRIDGILAEYSKPPKDLETALISRIKIISGLDITERRKPQDGRLTISLGNRTVDFRVSTVKVAWGEKVVLRILDKSSVLVSLEKIGFSPTVFNKFSKTITKPSGILLVTGPTGSGKTTTLYSALDKLNTPDKNIVTVEDPVEFNLASINQIPVNHKIGVTFASGLRSILRQDPDVIMIGEIRDVETATIAIQASQTGHFVFSTLHTNNAPAAMTRMVDMGVQPFLIASSVAGVLAQRLVRMVCPGCKKEVQLTDTEKDKFSDLIKDIEARYGELKVYKGGGCKMCGGKGYKGRVGIFEFLEVDDEIQALVVKNATSEEIRILAKEKGMKTMRDDGIEKIYNGVTTLDEVLRVMSE